MRLGAHNKSEWPIKQLLKPSFTPGWRLKKRLSLFWTRKYKTVQCQEHRSISFSCGHCWKDHTKSSFGKTSRLWVVSRTRDACVASNICSSQGISQKDVSMSRLHALITIHYFSKLNACPQIVFQYTIQDENVVTLAVLPIQLFSFVLRWYWKLTYVTCAQILIIMCNHSVFFF